MRFIQRLPFLDVHVAETLDGPITPGQADIAKVRIEGARPARGTGDFHVVFPELQDPPALRARAFNDVLGRPISSTHSRTLTWHAQFSS